jgi:8-oxo-dGTP pyrophosphatase MutT (NUDIX family)
MRWTVHGERTVYDSPWVRVTLADVEIPGGRRFEHHVVRSTAPAAGVVVRDEARGVLLLWRHRFITDTWGWEVPAGRREPGESIEQAAAREVLEETGWAPGPLRFLVDYAPANGIADHRFHLFVADGATYVGEPSDPSEAERVEWTPVEEVRRLVRDGRVPDGLSLTALLWALLHEEI